MFIIHDFQDLKERVIKNILWLLINSWRTRLVEKATCFYWLNSDFLIIELETRPQTFQLLFVKKSV